MGFLSGLLGGGGGGGDQTSTSTTDVPAWARPYLQQYMQQGAALGQGQYTPYSGQRYVSQNPYQAQGIEQQAAMAQGGAAVNNAASGNLTSTLNGDYLSSGNPYLTQQIDKAQGDVVRNYNLTARPRQDQMMARSGSFGNSGVQQASQEEDRMLQDNLSNISVQMRGADYTNERNRQMQAAGLAPGASAAGYNDAQQLYNAGTAANQPAQQDADFAYQQWTDQQNDPYKRLTATGAPFGANLGSVSTQTGAPGSSTAGALGGGLAGWGMGRQMGLGGWGQAGTAAAGAVAGKS
jgi:hypothetical protein